MRFITLNKANKIIGIRNGKAIVGGEIEASNCKLGQLMQKDGTFVDDPQDAMDEQLAESKTQKRALINQMIVANALRDDDEWIKLKAQYDLI